jgi:hypothetical protein
MRTIPILILLFTALAFGQQATICVKDPAGKEVCRNITAEAWDSADQFQQSSCKAETPVTVKGETKPAEPVTKCQYADVPDVIFQHVSGYLGDLKRAHPPTTTKPLKASLATAKAAVEAEEAKPVLTEVKK